MIPTDTSKYDIILQETSFGHTLAAVRPIPEVQFRATHPESYMGEGEPWLLLTMFGHTSITLYFIVNLLIYPIKMICTKRNPESF